METTHKIQNLARKEVTQQHENARILNVVGSSAHDLRPQARREIFHHICFEQTKLQTLILCDF